VPSQTRTKATASGAKVKSKSGRRSPVNVRVKKGSDLPVLPIAVAGILVALFVGLFIYGWVNNKSGSSTPGTVAGIPCDKGEQTQVHYHSALQMIYQGNLVHIPAGIGITGGEAAPTCLYWLHVHSSTTDVLHIESPATSVFTLGQFFDVWNAWSTAQGGPSEPLDSKHVSVFALKPGQSLLVFVDANDGKGPQLFSGDPRTIVLKNHEVITLEITPPGAPPPTFTWPSGL
jgi:hypothetical protein